jgi:hypothetical protein
MPASGRGGFNLLLDAHGFEGDREVLGSVVPQGARRQAGVIRRAAAAGDPASVALLPIAGLLESSAVDVEALPRRSGECPKAAHAVWATGGLRPEGQRR